MVIPRFRRLYAILEGAGHGYDMCMDFVVIDMDDSQTAAVPQPSKFRRVSHVSINDLNFQQHGVAMNMFPLDQMLHSPHPVLTKHSASCRVIMGT